MTEAPSLPAARVHIVLVPGFAGFDALGRIEYYAGTTATFQRWRDQRGLDQPVALHYFDNLPTAGVSTRAERLRSYLATRIARREIDEHDTIALIGHSTGGLDIREVLYSPKREQRHLHVDGGDGGEPAGGVPPTAIHVHQSEILDKVSRVVFISVPQYGTNIADWVRAHGPLRRMMIETFYRAVQSASLQPVEKLISSLIGGFGDLVKQPDLLKAAQDALNETTACSRDPVRQANADEAASQLRLWLQHATHDFTAIDDLASFTEPPTNSTSPAHYCEGQRHNEIELWKEKQIETLSIATIGRRAFDFDPDRPAPPFDLRARSTWPTAHRLPNARQMDVSYLYAYRACAGGHFDFPPSVSALCHDIANIDRTLFHPARLGAAGPKPGERLAVWDNDGIVNTASMLWPNRETTRLVAADHVDIVGHYRLRETRPSSPDYFGRRFASYDALKSQTGFAQADFDPVWNEVFDFCVSLRTARQGGHEAT